VFMIGPLYWSMTKIDDDIMSAAATLGAGGALLSEYDVPLWWATTGLGVHVMWTLPFCLIICLTFFNRFDRSLEDAGLTLGATRLSDM
jgi:ABC-type spermidine/putrescine transport system permease subunit II